MEQLSAELNWIACTFVFNANTSIRCFDEVFRESRSLRNVIESSLRIVYAEYAVITLTLLINFVCGMPDYITLFDVFYITMISIPLSAFFCMQKPFDPEVMKFHVASPKYLQNRYFLDSTQYRNYTTAI